MIIAKLQCATCGKEHETEINLESVSDFDVANLTRRIEEGAEWIVEINAGHFDIYCSEDCAT